jgi:hypothetical protein
VTGFAVSVSRTVLVNFIFRYLCTYVGFFPFTYLYVFRLFVVYL